MMDKVAASAADAVADIDSGSVIGIAGFGVIHGWHCERGGQPKIVGACTYDVTGTECVDLIVTDLAVIERLTEAPLVVDLWPPGADRAGDAARPASAVPRARVP
jgi:hypothetical protein